MSTQPDRKPWLRAIIENPHEYLPRKAFADFLKEHEGDRHSVLRGEFIDWQFGGGAMPWDLQRFADKRHLYACDGASVWFSKAAGAWVHPQGPFLGCYEWCHPTATNKDMYTAIHDTKLIWRNGFVEEVHIRMTALLGGPCWYCDGGRWRAGFSPLEVCGVCDNERIVQGCVEDLFRSQPVKKIRLTDSRAWFRITDPRAVMMTMYDGQCLRMDRILRSIQALRDGGIAPMADIELITSSMRDDADSWVSDGIIRYCRDELGLPAMTLETDLQTPPSS